MKANEAGVKHEDLMEYFVMRMERIIFMKAVQVINFESIVTSTNHFVSQ